MKAAPSGFILPLVLLICTLMAGLAGAVCYYSFAAISLYGTFKHALMAKSEVASKLLKGIQPQSNSRFGCRSAFQRHGKVEITREICQLTSLAPEELLAEGCIDGSRLMDPQLFPLFDYNNFFLSPTACNPTPFRCDQPSSLILTPAAGCSAGLCAKAPRGDGDLVAVLANLDLSEKYLIEAAPHAHKPFVLAASGFIHLEELELRRNALIVAGGDLILDHLSNWSKREVTLVAATGRVQVRSISGTMRLRALGKAGVYLPIGAVCQTQSLSLLPKGLPLEILGLYRPAT
jgi:hypothetical protein